MGEREEMEVRPGNKGGATVPPTKFREWRFRVPGPLLGYRASVRRCFDPRYGAYKDDVVTLAREAGLYELDPKLSYVTLSVQIFWRKKPRIDWTNVYKAIEDALWPRDRYVRPGPCSWAMNTGFEEAHVTVERIL